MISGWGVDQNRGTDFENSVIRPVLCSTGKNLWENLIKLIMSWVVGLSERRAVGQKTALWIAHSEQKKALQHFKRNKIMV